MKLKNKKNKNVLSKEQLRFIKIILNKLDFTLATFARQLALRLPTPDGRRLRHAFWSSPVLSIMLKDFTRREAGLAHAKPQALKVRIRQLEKSIAAATQLENQLQQATLGGNNEIKK